MIYKGLPGKKVLSLVLCVAVMLSVMVLGAGAAFSDQDQIENTEAVDMCSVLNIIGGYEDGSFHPERNIKRSEISKMICVALNGGVEPNLSVPATPTFSDVRNTADGWAEKYIESCVAQGIVSGVGGGRFSPAGNVTGSQLAKMLLVAIGYDADIEKFTGNSWDTNVNVIATQKGLYEGLESMDVSAAVTRDQAAQMVWNAMEAVMVEYTYTLVSENGQLVSKPVVGDKAGDPTLLSEKYKAVTVKGLLTDVSYDSDKQEYTYTVWDDTSTATGAATDTVDSGELKSYTTTGDYTDLYMQNVKVLYKMKDNKANVYGITANDSTVLVSGVLGDIDDYGTLTGTDKKIKLDEAEYKLDQDIDNTSVFGYMNVGLTMSGGSNKLTDVDLAVLSGYDGTAITATYAFDLIDRDGNGKGDYIVVYPFVAGQVSYVGADTFNVDGIGAGIEKDDVIYYDGIAKDDYVIMVNENNTVEGKDTYTKIDTVVSGEVTSVKGNPATDVEIDGTWYKTTAATNFMVLSGEYEIAVVNGYAVVAEELDSAVSADDYAVVIKAEASASGLNKYAQAKLLKANGETVTVDVADDYSAMADKLVTYEEDDDVYTLTLATDEGFDGALTTKTYSYASNGKSTIDDTSISDSAIVFLMDGDRDWSVVTGENFKKYGAATVANALYNESSSTGYNTVELIAASVTSTSYGDKNYGYVTGTVSTSKKDGDTVYNIPAWDGSDNVTLTADNNVVAKGDLFEYTINDDDTIHVTKIVASGTDGNDGYTQGAIASWDSSKSEITFTKNDLTTLADYSGNTKYEITDDTVIMFINQKNVAGVAGDASSLDLADKYGAYYVSNVVYKVNDGTGEVDFIVMDVNNEMLYTTGVKTLTNPTDAQITTALGTADTVIVNGDVTLPNSFNVGSGKTLVVNGNVTLGSSATVTVAGTMEVTGNVTVGSGNTLTVNGALTVNGTLNLAGGTQNGSGTVKGDILGMGSTISGTLTMEFEKAVVSGNMNIACTSLIINGAITGDSTKTLTITNGNVAVGNVACSVAVSGGNVTAGDVAGTVTAGSGVVVIVESAGDTAGDGTVSEGTPTVANILQAALAYEYGSNYDYTNGVSVSGTTVSYEASAEEYQDGGSEEPGDVSVATADLARFVGAIYRFNNGASVSKITYDGKDYTWNADLGLKGSNWANGETTLISAVAAFLNGESNPLEDGSENIEFTINETVVTLALTVSE